MLPFAPFYPSAPSYVAACMFCMPSRPPRRPTASAGPMPASWARRGRLHVLRAGWDSETPTTSCGCNPPRAPCDPCEPLQYPVPSRVVLPGAPPDPHHALVSKAHPEESERREQEWTIGRQPSDRGVEGARYRVQLHLLEDCAALEARPIFCFETPQGDSDSDLVFREFV